MLITLINCFIQFIQYLLTKTYIISIKTNNVHEIPSPSYQNAYILAFQCVFQWKITEKESLGFRIPTRTWTDLLRAVARSQSGSGGFDYAPGSGAAPYASMTVAGIAVLQICKQALGRQLPTSVKTTNRLKAAWNMLRRYWAEDAGIATDVRKVRA